MRKAVMPTRGASAARGPVAPTAEKMFEASDTSVEVEIGGTANVAPRIVNGPWKPNARKTSHAIMITMGTAATSAGVARIVASPRVIDVRILGIGTALGPRGAKIESSSPFRGACSGVAGARYDEVGRRCCFFRRLLTARRSSGLVFVVFPGIRTDAGAGGDILGLEVRRSEARDQGPTREHQDHDQRDRGDSPVEHQRPRLHDRRALLIDENA